LVWSTSPRSGWLRASRSAPCWAQAPAGPALTHQDVDQQRFAWIPEYDFANLFAADDVMPYSSGALGDESQKQSARSQ
jgi:hypothetical protein